MGTGGFRALVCCHKYGVRYLKLHTAVECRSCVQMSWRVSRRDAAAGAVDVRVRAMACRSGADSEHASGHSFGPPVGDLGR